MNFSTPSKMVDIKALHTGLPANEIKLAILESRRLQQIRELGDAYLLHPKNAPKRASYNPLTGALLAA
ncbi:hypothetical protein CBM2586_B10230 [Cupriavidus phytorum]|uniref:Uncharacterized protein n=1 Tax=Cupriavidus taiwanensis TaxID=164546 RepID=A0A975XEG0_9BURK|nr:hypothetical protein [Cupriavidus taiwanensis]SOY65635.1 hypothetical protein CBM2586_B10230 [Cupriavidus taiwanensis]